MSRVSCSGPVRPLPFHLGPPLPALTILFPVTGQAGWRCWGGQGWLPRNMTSRQESVNCRQRAESAFLVGAQEMTLRLESLDSGGMYHLPFGTKMRRVWEPQGRKQGDHGGVGVRFCPIVAEVCRRVGFYIWSKQFSKCGPETCSIGSFSPGQTLKDAHRTLF